MKTMTSDRDRLIELFQEMDKDFGITCPNINTNKSCKGCKYRISGAFIDCDYLARKVDYLLANGVIVPPCKVGDMVYRTSLLDEVVELKVDALITAVRTKPYNAFSLNDIGETVFLTKQEAEEKLRELKNNVDL